MSLTILSLVQVATLPRLMMRTPERLTLPLPCSMLFRHLVLSHLQIVGENRSWLQGSKQVCEKWTLTKGEAGAQSAPGGGNTENDEPPPPSPYALAERFLARDPQAIGEVEALLASAGQGLEEALARALAAKISDVERIDRMIASQETRRNGVLRELERHRATLGAELRRLEHDPETWAPAVQ